MSSYNNYSVKLERERGLENQNKFLKVSTYNRLRQKSKLKHLLSNTEWSCNLQILTFNDKKYIKITSKVHPSSCKNLTFPSLLIILTFIFSDSSSVIPRSAPRHNTRSSICGRPIKEKFILLFLIRRVFKLDIFNLK